LIADPGAQRISHTVPRPEKAESKLRARAAEATLW
jgi:hypothetical protein